MKNLDIFNMVNAGILAITANDLGAEHAYKVHKFKKAVRKVFDALAESETALLKEAGIENANAFDLERESLRSSGADAERLADLDKTFERFAELRKSLYDEDVALEGVKVIPFAVFHELQRENKDMSRKPLNAFEDLLEGVLWAEEEKEGE